MGRPLESVHAWVKALLDAGARVNGPDPSRRNLLGMACARRAWSLAQLLISAGATRGAHHTPWPQCPDALIMLLSKAAPNDCDSPEGLALLDRLLPPSQADYDRLLYSALDTDRYDWASYWEDKGGKFLSRNPDTGNNILHLLLFRLSQWPQDAPVIMKWIEKASFAGVSIEDLNNEAKSPQDIFLSMIFPSHESNDRLELAKTSYCAGQRRKLNEITANSQSKFSHKRL
jgi:hypothetical protein